MKGKKRREPIQETKRPKTINSGSPNKNEDFSKGKELNYMQKRIAKWLTKLRFRRQFFGGVNEGDVWNKIVELNSMYEAALMAERVRYDTMIEHYKKVNKTTTLSDIPMRDILGRGDGL